MSSTRYTGVENHIGKTPLIRLRRLSELTGCEILGKAEFMNPGGSVKDRAALGIILDAESDGQLRPGDTIVEGTAGTPGVPSGRVLFTNDLQGTLLSNSCDLTPAEGETARCSVSYRPEVVGTHTVTARYEGESPHQKPAK